MTSKMSPIYFSAVILFGVFGSAVSLICSSCTNVESINKCKDKEYCGDDQTCFTRIKYVPGISMTFYTMGCTNNTNCGNVHVYNTLSSDDAPKKDCFECCGGNLCNKQLCDHPKPIPCVDASEECSYWNNKFNICDDIHEAKLICRKFCNLCKVVDGNWAQWSAWSDCDVTCGEGKLTRTRTCTDPAPAYGGLDCEGESIDTKDCYRPLCPVHGNWADWAVWSDCPVECGTGIQKRFRTCSSPSPLRYGEHCFGESMDVRLCAQTPCSGRDGGWSGWGEWDSCSVLCDGGIRQRLRSCTDPVPDPQGLHCFGSPLEVEACNNQACDNTFKAIVFNAYYVTDCSPQNGQVMIFSNVLLNEGGAYNNETGVFVAPRDGTYMFNAQLCTLSSKSMKFSITVDGVSYALTYGRDTSYCECITAQTAVVLAEGNNVYVEWIYYSYGSTSAVCQGSDNKNYFSGAFIG